MKKFLLILLIFSLSLQKSFAQCTCTASGTQYPSSTLTPTTSFQTISVFGGEYALFNVSNGVTYTWSFCTSDGGSSAFDTRLNLYNNTTLAWIACNADAAGCGLAAKITWTANFTGVVRVKTNIYFSSANPCGVNVIPHSRSTLAYRHTPCSDSYESNNSCTSASTYFPVLFTSPYSGSLSSYISTSSDVDWFRLGLDGPGTLTINLTGLPNNYNLQLYGYANNCNTLINQSINSGTSSEQIIFNYTTLASTAVFVRIYGNNNAFSCLPYTLSINWSPAAPPTYNLTTTVYNVTNVPVSNAKVKLWNSNFSSVLQTRFTNASGQVTFPGLTNANYNYEVFYTPPFTPPVTPNEEFWGTKAVTINGSSITQTFTRNQPHITSPPSFSNLAPILGQLTTGSFIVRNNLPYAENSYVEIWVDRNRVSPWDYHNTASVQSVNSGGTRTYNFNVTPANTGLHEFYAFVYSFVNSGYTLTDQYAWTSAFTATCPLLATPTSPTPGTASAPGPVLPTPTPTFSWGGSSSGIYHIQIWNAATNPITSSNVIYGFESPISSPGHCINGLSHTIPNGVLVNNGQYKWRIHRNDPCGECESDPALSQLLYFQVAPLCTPPSTPSNPTSNSPQVGSVTITRSGSPPAGETWFWQGTSCGTSTNLGSGATFIATASGRYYIRAFNNTSSCWSSSCGFVDVTVTPCTPPNNPPNPTSNSPQSNNVTITRSGTPPSGETWYWQGTSCGTSTNFGSGATFIATASGRYYIRAFNNTSNCWSSGCGFVDVTVTPCTPPNNPPNPTSNSPQSNNVTITRSGTPPAGDTWYWQGTSCGTNTNLGSGATFIATASGRYYIRAFNNTSNCWSSGCGFVDVTVTNPQPSITITSSTIPPWQRQNDAYQGSVTVSTSNPAGASWHLQVKVYNSITNNLINTINYPPITSATQNFFSTDPLLNAASIADREMRYFAVLESNGNSQQAGITAIIETQWVNKNVVLYNNAGSKLRIPLKYVQGATKVTVSFCRNKNLSSSSENIKPTTFYTQCNTSLFGCFVPSIYGCVNCPSNPLLIYPQFCQVINANTGYFELDVGNTNNLADVPPGVFDFAVTYHNNNTCPTGSQIGGCENGIFDLVKIGKYGSTSNQSKIIVLVGGSINLEAALKSLSNQSNPNTQAWSIAKDLTMSPQNRNVWYIATGNLNPIQKNAYNIGKALEEIKRINNYGSSTNISVIAHSKGGLEARMMMDRQGASNASSSNFNLNLPDSYKFINPGIDGSLKSVIFIGTPHNNGVLTSLFTPGYGNTSIAPPSFISNQLNAPNIKNYFRNGTTVPSSNNIRIGNVTGLKKCNDLSDGGVSILSSESPVIFGASSSKQFYFGDKGNPDEFSNNTLCGIFAAAASLEGIPWDLTLEACTQIIGGLSNGLWRRGLHHVFLTSSYLLNNSSNTCVQNTSILNRIISIIDDVPVNGCNSPVSCPSWLIQDISSVLPNAIVSKKNGDSSYLKITKSDENGIFELRFDESLSLGDTIKIEAPGVETILIPLNSATIFPDKIKIPFLKSSTPSQKIQYPFFKLVTNNPVINNPIIQIEVKADFATDYQILKNNDSVFTLLALNNNRALINLDTGLNMIAIRYIGSIDTVTLYKELWYIPDTLLNEFTYRLNISTDSTGLGTKVYVNNEFFKEIPSVNDSLLLVLGENRLKFTKFGFRDTTFYVNSSSSLNLAMVPIASIIYNVNDSSIINFPSQRKIEYRKNVTAMDSAKQTIISIKQYDDNFSGMGLIPKSRKFEIRHLNSNWSGIRFAAVRDEIENYSMDSVYLMRVYDNTLFTKISFDANGTVAGYDSAVQKLSYNFINFNNGTATKEALVIMKKKAPIVSNSTTFNINENDTLRFALSQFFSDPDSIHNDMNFQTGNSSPQLIIQIVGDSVLISPTPCWAGSRTFTLQAQHDGLWSSITNTVNVTASTPPTIVCPAPVTVSCASAVPTPNIASVTAGDNCPGVVVTHRGDTVSGQTCSNRYTITRRYRATDALGSYTECSQTITVNDQTAPVITSIPANVTVSCSSAVPAPNTGAVIATDNCSGALTVTSADVITPGSCVHRFSIARTYTVTDICGNSSSQVQTITVNDLTAPVITCPANISVMAPIGSCTAVVTYTVTATDNCAGTLTIVSVPASGTAFPIGVTTVTSTATDVCGNFSTCSFTVTVLDGQLPAITTQPTNRTVCESSNAVFDVVGSNAVSYQWQVSTGSGFINVPGATGSTLNLNNVTLGLNNALYRVRIIGLCTTITSASATLVVNPLPGINLFSSHDPALIPGQKLNIVAVVSPTGGTISWFKNGAQLSGITSFTLSNLTVDDIGTYRAIYTDLRGCSKTSADVVISGKLSSKLWIYPNPNPGQFLVRFFNQSNQAVILSIYDPKGSKVFQKNLVTSAITYSRIDVDLGNFSAGTYFLELRDSKGERIATGQVIIGRH